MAAQGDGRVLVLTPEGDLTITAVLGGVRKSLAGQPISTRYLSLARQDVLNPLRAAEPGTIFLGVGQRAIDDILRTRSAPALVACLLPSNETSIRAGGMVAIPAEVPAEIQAAWLRRLLGRVKRVGLLYDPDHSARQVAQMTEALQRVGLVAQPEPVRAPTALPEALARLQKRADVILGLNDRTVFTPQTAKAILLFSFRSRIPLVGLSDPWVKAGALYAIVPDYEDLGRQCGLAALHLAGLREDLPQHAARLVLSLNLRTAKHMRIDWPADVLHMASKTHE